MFNRLVVVLADGLRPDAITPDRMPTLYSLGRDYVRVRHAVTVRPSVTVAALTSLATGVSPDRHGFLNPGLAFLSTIHSLQPLPGVLGRHGITTHLYLNDMPRVHRPLVNMVVRLSGITRISFAGRDALDVARAARDEERPADRRLEFLYMTDADRAGHAHGWMSEPYTRAVVAVDRAIGLLTQSPNTMLLVLADHGGGGVTPTDHDTPHPVNDRIPIVIAGPGIRRRRAIETPTTILDVPPTILFAFGVDVPASYEGRALSGAFARERIRQE